MVALDIDGTLLNSKGQVPAMHKKIIQMVQEKGVHVVLATGRYYMQATGIMNELNYNGILVSNDGAVTIDGRTKQILYENSFSINDIAHFVKMCRKVDVQFAVVTAFNYYGESVSKEHKENCKEHGIEYMYSDDVLKISEKVMKFSIMDITKIGGWQHLEPTSNIRLRVDGEFWKEYMSTKATKTNALKEIANSLNILPSEIIAIGDYYNDLDMIEYAGVGIAMGNAPEDLKEKADDVTRSNDEDGVYYSLKKYLV
ncbi:Cof-type HAD-IIB family hydrolase [Gracilibacillus sp. D59]|uniref:Cof-type HAD-IIB family hydrolase n=1 Tax=Gracilibacillus sp. D59 TaxID=3457434 RepID=UPI003FCD8DD4